MDLARVIRGTLTIIKDADALYKQLKEVPEGLIAATRRINIIRSQLEYFERTLQDLDSCFVKTPSIHYVIEGDVAPLKHALYEFKAILSGLLMDGVVLMSRAHYALLGLRTLQKTQRVFTSIERDFEYLGNFVNTKSINDQPNSALYNTEILKQIRLKQRAEEEARKDESAQWSLLHLQIQDALNKVQNASCRKNTWEVEDLLGRVKLEMKKIGLATSVVESICANAANVLQIGHFKVLSSSKVQQTNVAGVYPQSKLLQTETLTADSPLSPTLQRSLNTSTWQILCTGRFNSHVGVTIVHAYLELIRIWTANRTGRWLYHCADSAWLHTKPDNSTEVKAAIEQANVFVDQLLPEARYSWPSKVLNELGDLRDRMKAYRTLRLSELTLSSYDVIICCNNDDRDRMIYLWELLVPWPRMESPPRWVVISTSTWFSKEDCRGRTERTEVRLGIIKASVEIWLKQCFSRWGFSYLDAGEKAYHTLQTLEHFTKEAHITNLKDSVLRERESNSGCSISIAPYRGTENSLLSIWGPLDKLEHARSMMTSSGQTQGKPGQHAAPIRPSGNPSRPLCKHGYPQCYRCKNHLQPRPQQQNEARGRAPYWGSVVSDPKSTTSKRGSRK